MSASREIDPSAPETIPARETRVPAWMALAAIGLVTSIVFAFLLLIDPWTLSRSWAEKREGHARLIGDLNAGLKRGRAHRVGDHVDVHVRWKNETDRRFERVVAVECVALSGDGTIVGIGMEKLRTDESGALEPGTSRKLVVPIDSLLDHPTNFSCSVIRAL